MRPIGFSTGALGLGDTRLALRKLEGVGVTAIEFSALRESELAPLIEFLKATNVDRFDYVSVHAPARFDGKKEREIVDWLSLLCDKGWPVVLHPDAVHDFGCWRELGASVLVENMDKRKPIGRTVDELQSIFLMLPEAGLCFDFAHARQYDPSMTEAYLILTTFADRIKQLHLSEVPTNSKHDRISPTAATAYRELSALIPPTVPVILETPVRREDMDAELAIARFALAGGKPEWLNSAASG